MNNLREKNNFHVKTKQNQGKRKPVRTQTRELSLRHLKGKKTTEKSKLTQPPPYKLSRTALFTKNINYISILSSYTI